MLNISRTILWFHVYSKVGNLRYANSPNRILNLKFETNAQMQRFAFQLPVNPFPVAISSHMDLCSWCFCISVKSWSGLCRVIDWSEICLTGQTYSSPIQRWPHSWWWWWWCSKSVGKIALDTLQHHLIWQIITFKISASIRLHWSRGIKILLILPTMASDGSRPNSTRQQIKLQPTRMDLTQIRPNWG